MVQRIKISNAVIQDFIAVLGPVDPAKCLNVPKWASSDPIWATKKKQKSVPNWGQLGTFGDTFSRTMHDHY